MAAESSVASAPFSGTAFWIAAARARESARPDRLFDDPWAATLAGDLGVRALEASERQTGSENAFMPIRTRFFDDVLMADAAALDQVVLLGAGFDTRAHRLGLPASVRCFELDRADILAAKDATLAAEGAEPTCRRIPVAVDLAADWPSELIRAGFEPDARTAWIAEGLLFYLPADSVDRMLVTARAMSGPGSLFGADAFGSGLLDRPAMAGHVNRLAERGLPPPFCTDDPVGLFERTGWESVEIVEPGQARANFGRIDRAGPGYARTAADPTLRAWLIDARADRAQPGASR